MWLYLVLDLHHYERSILILVDLYRSQCYLNSDKKRIATKYSNIQSEECDRLPILYKATPILLFLSKVI